MQHRTRMTTMQAFLNARAELIEDLRGRYNDEQIADFINVPARLIKHIRPIGYPVQQRPREQDSEHGKLLGESEYPDVPTPPFE